MLQPPNRLCERCRSIHAQVRRSARFRHDLRGRAGPQPRVVELDAGEGPGAYAGRGSTPPGANAGVPRSAAAERSGSARDLAVRGEASGSSWVGCAVPPGGAVSPTPSSVVEPGAGIVRPAVSAGYRGGCSRHGEVCPPRWLYVVGSTSSRNIYRERRSELDPADQRVGRCVLVACMADQRSATGDRGWVAEQRRRLPMIDPTLRTCGTGSRGTGGRRAGSAAWVPRRTLRRPPTSAASSVRGATPSMSGRSPAPLASVPGPGRRGSPAVADLAHAIRPRHLAVGGRARILNFHNGGHP